MWPPLICNHQSKTPKFSYGAYDLSKLTGQPIPIVMRILTLIKSIHPHQSNPKYYTQRRWFFRKTSWKNPISLPWSAGWPVQTFGSGLSQSLIIIIRISRKRSPLISDLDHLLGWQFYSFLLFLTSCIKWPLDVWCALFVMYYTRSIQRTFFDNMEWHVC